MSEKIIHLLNHTNKNRKDHTTNRFLMKLIDRRRNMLNYLRRTDYHYYKWVISEYHIPDIISLNANHKKNMRGIPNRV